MNYIEIEARAKINWCLYVTGIRANGYHELDMLLQSVSLCDRLSFTRSDAFKLFINGRAAVTPENNLCFKAYNAFCAYTKINAAVEIRLDKNIPVCAGMGGGSADAAAVLTALNMLFGTGIKRPELLQLGLSLGADVPFMLSGGLQRARGIGDELTPLHLGCPCYFVALMPHLGAATREVFSRLDSLQPNGSADKLAAELAAELAAGDTASAARSLFNGLQCVTASINPEISACIELLNKSGAYGAVMTGSGSACYGVYPTAKAADTAYRQLLKRCHFRVYRFATRSRGIDITAIR